MEKISSQKNVLREKSLYLQCRKGYDKHKIRKRSASFRLRNLDNSIVRGMKDTVLLWEYYMPTTYTAKGVSCFSFSKHRAVESLLVREKNGLTLLSYMKMVNMKHAKIFLFLFFPISVGMMLDDIGLLVPWKSINLINI